MIPQYLSDQNGIPNSIVIPLEEWNRLTKKYNGLENELDDNNIYNLSDEQEKVIDIALNSMKRGNEISHDTIMKETRKKYPQLFKNK